MYRELQERVTDAAAGDKPRRARTSLDAIPLLASSGVPLRVLNQMAESYRNPAAYADTNIKAPILRRRIEMSLKP